MKLKINKIVKAAVAILVAVPMILTSMPAAKVSAATITNDQSKIAMYSREANGVYHATYIYTNYIRVAKSMSSGKVYLNTKYHSGTIEKKEAAYVCSLDNEYNIYEASCGEMGYTDECYVSCEANGNTYIDNNNGKNYTKEFLGVAPIRALRSYCGSSKYYGINAVVKNLAYQKDVRVRYTIDNWKTYKEASLKYDRTLNDGTEAWYTSIDTTGASENGFHYALSYTVNGQTYWDNNFEKNYDYSFSSDY